jgi:hypothetical protein
MGYGTVSVLFPGLALQIFRALNCVPIEPGLMVLEMYPSVQCWESRDHMVILGASFLGMVLYIGVFPYIVTSTIAEAEREGRLDDRDFRKNWGWAYAVYTREWLHWYSNIVIHVSVLALTRTCLWGQSSQMPLTMFVVIGMGLMVVSLNPYADPYMDAVTVFGYG